MLSAEGERNAESSSPLTQGRLISSNQADMAVRALARQQEASGDSPSRALRDTAPLTPGTGDFPPLPPDPYASRQPPLPSVAEELYTHGGSYLYQPEGDRLGVPSHDEVHFDYLRLPESWQEPRPVEAFSEFLGADPIILNPNLKWPGGYSWHPEFVGYGRYDVFGVAFEQNNQQVYAVGHQLEAELDLRLTGTERFHAQFRPIGDGGSGGSLYKFNRPSGYIDNSTAEPQRYWFEGELHSMLGGYLDPFSVLDVNVTAGKFPLALHNFFLMNDEIQGVVLSKNTWFIGPLSNLNAQVFYGFNDVDTFPNEEAQLGGIHLSVDIERIFYEATYAHVAHETDSLRDSHFAALSRTSLHGPLTMTARVMSKWGDQGGAGSGQLYVLENNYVRYYDHPWLGVESAVFFANAFAASEGWSSISGGGFNRVRTAFEVNPATRLAAGGPASTDTLGVTLGVQLFRHHEDESFVPEIAYESPNGEPVYGVGLRYLRKLGPRTYIEALGVANFSDDPQYERKGVILSHSIVF
jgi:hypothetical protein